MRVTLGLCYTRVINNNPRVTLTLGLRYMRVINRVINELLCYIRVVLHWAVVNLGMCYVTVLHKGCA